MILICNDFWHKIKMYNFDPYNVLFYTCAAYDRVCALGPHIYLYICIYMFLYILYNDNNNKIITIIYLIVYYYNYCYYYFNISLEEMYKI